MPWFHVRDAVEGDLAHIVDIDIKTFENPWSSEEWCARHHQVLVATYFGTPVGVMALCRTSDGDLDVRKLAVKQSYRGRGIGRLLLAAAARCAQQARCVCLFMVLPERSICPGSPKDLSRWLTRLGFRAVTPILAGHFSVCGETEDGVKFILPL